MEKITCPICGSEDTESTTRDQTARFCSEYFTYVREDHACYNCKEEWVYDDHNYDIARNKLIDSMYEKIKYDPDVAKFYGLGWSDLTKASTPKEKALIVALYLKYNPAMLK